MPHYRSIHYLRAVAALMVIWFHIQHSALGVKSLDAPYIWMRHGVDIFFVISGFVITLSTNNNQLSAKEFFIRRCERIVPLYWLITIVTMLLSKWDWTLVFASFFFIPLLHSSNGAFQPILPPGWTLNYEMFFYLIFAISLLLRVEWRLPYMAATFCGFVLLGVTLETVTLLNFYTSPMILEFIIGMAIARYRWRLPVVFLPAGFALLAFGEPLSLSGADLGQILPVTFIVAGALSLEGRLPRLKILDLLGDSSYALYLSHLPAIALLLVFWPDIGLSKNAFAIISFIAAVVIGISIHRSVERPIIAWFKSKRHRITECKIHQQSLSSTTL